MKDTFSEKIDCVQHVHRINRIIMYTCVFTYKKKCQHVKPDRSSLFIHANTREQFVRYVELNFIKL